MQCKNCDSRLNKKFKYCPECGQKVLDKLTVKDLFHNLVSNYFSVDARFYRSFIPLIIKPGHLAETFVSGKRLKFLHPVRFYIFVSLIFFFLLSITTIKDRQDFDQQLQRGFEGDTTADSAHNNIDPPPTIAYTFDDKELDSLIQINASKEEKLKTIGYEEGGSRFSLYFHSQILKVYEQSGKGILDVIFDIIPIALFFFLPIFALIMKLLFYKEARYSHHLVFSFYFFSFFFLVYSLFLIAGLLFNIPFWIFLLIIFVYLFFGMKRFYNKKILTTISKEALVILINLILLFPFISLIFLISLIAY